MYVIIPQNTKVKNYKTAMHLIKKLKELQFKAQVFIKAQNEYELFIQTAEKPVELSEAKKLHEKFKALGINTELKKLPKDVFYKINQGVKV